MKKNTVDTKEKFRVFVVATDAEWVSKDMLEQEIGQRIFCISKFDYF
jgi:hypothetical protein